jgi:predicted AAA+ superfamily ATPase
VQAIRLLVEMLRESIGSPLSYTSIAGDLQIAPDTVRNYVEIPEGLCIILLVRPFHSNIARAILREPKAYFFDSGYVRGDEGLKSENACAVQIWDRRRASRHIDGIGSAPAVRVGGINVGRVAPHPPGCAE